MSEMQQATAATQIAPAPASPPATATPQTAPVAPGGPPTSNLDLSKFNVRQLRSMLSELRNQRSDLASRRSNTGDIYENATGANREGIGERLKTLDANIIRFENEIARVGTEIAARGGETITEQPGGNIPRGYMSEDDAAGMAFGFSFATLLLAVFFTRRFMRRKYGRMPAPQHQGTLQSSERLDRIEQAVDTIAVEIERVSENQRFMTRLMTETQLGDTIKDVRKSAELAKSAAENSG
jgi:hypothetical protein